MTFHPIMSYELAAKRDQEMLADAQARRDVLQIDCSDTQQRRQRPLLAGVGRLLISAGEKLSGVNLPKSPDLASNPQ